MVIRSKFSLFMFMLAPVIIAIINIESFFVLTSILILFTSGKSLKRLYIVNFGSDAAFDALEQKYHQRKSLDEQTRQLNRTMIFLLNLLFIIFFVYTYFVGDSVLLRVASLVTVANWIYDMLRTFVPQAKMSDNSEWTFKDTLAEFFLWFHSILTVLVVVAVFAIKFL